jgi:hypothetical protein
MGFIPLAAGHHAAKRQKAVVDLLRERRALQRAAAQSLPDLSSSQRRRIDHLVDRDIVRVVAGNRYYLDEDALQEWHSRHWAMAFSFLVIAAGVAAAWLLTR